MTTIHSRPLGILMLCLWSLGLMVEIAVRIGLAALGQTPSQEWTFSLTLPLAAAAALCVIALIVTCVGLWKMRSWARRLFLIQITAYYGLLLLGSLPLWGPIIGVPIGRPGQEWVTTVLLEGIVGLGFGWWYLNRRIVRSWFHSTTSSSLYPADSDGSSGKVAWE